MDKLRDWGFPTVLIVAWAVAAAYTVSFLIGPTEQVPPPAGSPPAISDSKLPAS